MELEWLKESPSCSEVRELRKLVDHDHPNLVDRFSKHILS
jgi:hypothetical protein